MISSTYKPPSFDIVRMEEDDLDEVMKIESESFSSPWKRRHFEIALSDDTCCIVAKVAGKVVGYGIGWFVFREIHIANLAVDKELRRKGIGVILLRHMIDIAGERRVVIVTLEVRESNLAAINLYRKEGFREVTVRKDYYSRPREDAIIMAKFLRGDQI